MNSEPISHELSHLSRKSLTTLTLSALDFVIPGSYHNCNSLDDMVQVVTGDVRVGRLQAISNHVDQLYAANSGAQRAVWLYKMTDSADKAVAAASFANKVGGKFQILSFFSKITPKADTTQAVDLCLKLTVEVLAYLSLRGLSGESLTQWVKDLNGGRYGNESALRLAALIGIDGLLPLGPDFLDLLSTKVKTNDFPWSDSPLFQKIADQLPGASQNEKTGFVANLVDTVCSPIETFVEKTGLTREKVFSSLESFTDVTDSKLDYVAAFLDASTDFMSHTGVQTVARDLVTQSASRFGYEKAV
jgi:hypothetical protein